MGAMIMQILDTTIANVALPHMQTALGATADTITWVLTSYIVATAIAMPATGWLSDRLGSRNLFLIAVGGFVVASMLCGTAPSRWRRWCVPRPPGRVRGVHQPAVARP